MARAILSVPDISCEHCERTIKQVLGSAAGVKEVQVDIPGKTVRLEYDEQAISLDRVSTLLAEEGYPVATTQPL
ncbi:MAG TPA: heavy-metal-associated domain-containing protein [Chloroflexota bacterium]|nr:heavy-metal-associated domain-containing protein [Chloroflexota bacterium]